MMWYYTSESERRIIKCAYLSETYTTHLLAPIMVVGRTPIT